MSSRSKSPASAPCAIGLSKRRRRQANDLVMAPHAVFPAAAPMKAQRRGGDRAVLFHNLGAGLADGSILVAGATAATDRADQLAAFDQRKSAGTRNEGGIERGDIG